MRSSAGRKKKKKRKLSLKKEREMFFFLGGFMDWGKRERKKSFSVANLEKGGTVSGKN